MFLDDPSREKIDLADLKSFVTTEENQTCHGRYNDVKLAKNCCRAYAANDIEEEDEPKDDARMFITMEEFLRLLRRTFPGDKPADIRAVLKRTVVFVFGKSALYLRLPSQNDDAPVHRIQIEDIHKDLLAPHDKLSYGKYKGGDTAKPVGYEDAILKEQDMVSKSMAKYKESESAQAYVTTANDKIYDLLLRNQPIPAKAWLPSSPESDSPQRPGPIYQDAMPGTVPKRLGQFVYPPRKRLRSKTSDDGRGSSAMPSAAVVSSLEALAHDAESDFFAREAAADAPAEDDFAADEDAAAFLSS